MYHGLRTDGRKIGLRAVDSADFDERELRVAGGNGLEGQSTEASLTRDAGCVGRTTGGDGDEAVVVAMYERGKLKVVEARAPLEKMFGYSNAMRSLSQGRASYSMEPLEYAAAPDEMLESLAGG